MYTSIFVHKSCAALAVSTQACVFTQEKCFVFQNNNNKQHEISDLIFHHNAINGDL